MIRKLFAGFLLTPEISIQLQRSKMWKEKMFQEDDGLDRLVEVRYQGKDYLGQYFPEHKHDLNDVKAKESTLRQLLQSYCPQQDCTVMKLCVFPQLFVS